MLLSLDPTVDILCLCMASFKWLIFDRFIPPIKE